MAYPSIPDSCDFSQLPTTTVTGIYFLWAGGRIVYVGQSRTIGQRLCQHIGDKTKKFDRFSYVKCDLRRIASWERHYIDALVPLYNRCPRSKLVRRLKDAGMEFNKIKGVRVRTARI